MSNEAMRQALAAARDALQPYKTQFYRDEAIEIIDFALAQAEKVEPMRPAGEEDRAVYKAIADNYSKPKPQAQQDVPQDGLFIEMIAKHEGLEEEMKSLPEPAPQEVPQAAEPSAEQMKQLLDGLGRCHVAASRYEFLRTWIRDWTDHKLQSHREAIAKKDAALMACVEAAEICSLAMDDWLNTYAEELCDQERVKEAKERIEISGGTLAYITDVRTNLDSAIAKAQEAMKP